MEGVISQIQIEKRLNDMYVYEMYIFMLHLW